MRSQRAYEVARPDQNHVDMLQTLRNLGAFYMQSEKYGNCVYVLISPIRIVRETLGDSTVVMSE